MFWLVLKPLEDVEAKKKEDFGGKRNIANHDETEEFAAMKSVLGEQKEMQKSSWIWWKMRRRKNLRRERNQKRELLVFSI